MRIKSDKQIAIRLSNDLDWKLDQVATIFQLSKSDVIRRFCQDGVERFANRIPTYYPNQKSNELLLNR
jgi:predicted transcriptional regulator